MFLLALTLCPLPSLQPLSVGHFVSKAIPVIVIVLECFPQHQKKTVGHPEGEKRHSLPFLAKMSMHVDHVRLLVMCVVRLLLPPKTHDELLDLAVTQLEVGGCTPG